MSFLIKNLPTPLWKVYQIQNFKGGLSEKISPKYLLPFTFPFRVLSSHGLEALLVPMVPYIVEQVIHFFQQDSYLDRFNYLCRRCARYLADREIFKKVFGEERMKKVKNNFLWDYREDEVYDEMNVWTLMGKFCWMAMVFYPLNVIQMKLWIDVAGEKSFSGVFDCVAKTFKIEGLLGFYSGFSVQLLSCVVQYLVYTLFILTQKKDMSQNLILFIDTCSSKTIDYIFETIRLSQISSGWSSVKVVKNIWKNGYQGFFCFFYVLLYLYSRNHYCEFSTQKIIILKSK